MRNLFVLISLGLSLSAQAEPSRTTTADCLVSAVALVSPEYDSSVELELKMRSEVMALITTKDGTLKPVSRNGVHAEVLDWIGKNAPEYLAKPTTLPWDRLPYRLKVIALSRPGEIHSFFSNRLVDGTKVRETITVVFPRKTNFLGREYKRGKYEIETKEFLQPHVEFADPLTMGKIGDIELHFRVRQTAGTASRDAWTLLEAVNIPRNHQHVHIVAPLPLERLKRNPEREGFRTADFVRRANLLAEMISTLEGTNLKADVRQGMSFFNFHSPQAYSALHTFLAATGSGKDPVPRSFKNGWIGVNFNKKYDQPNLYGLEYRAIDDITPPKLIQATLDGLQYDMIHDNLGISAGDFGKWQAAHSGVSLDQLVYHGLPIDFPEGTRAQRRKLLQLARKDDTYRMLLFDWSQDPVLFGKTVAIEKVKQEQATALKRIFRGSMPTDRILHDFVIKSGLFDEVAGSLNMPHLAEAARRLPRP